MDFTNLKTLCQLDGVSGREEAVLFCFKRENGFSVTEDRSFSLGYQKK